MDGLQLFFLIFLVVVVAAIIVGFILISLPSKVLENMEVKINNTSLKNSVEKDNSADR